MPQARLLPYLSPVLVLYLVASVASAEGSLHPAEAAMALLAVLLSFVPLLRARRPEADGSRRVGLLGVCAAVIVVGEVRPGAVSLAVELGRLAALAGFAGLVTHLSLTVPDRPRAVMRYWAARVLPYPLAAASGAAGLLAALPPFAPFGETWLLVPALTALPLVHATLALPFALCMRLLRRRLGSTPEELASNSWAVLGLAPASAIALPLLVLRVAGAIGPDQRWFGGGVAAAALLVVSGHVALVDARQQLSAGRAARNATTVLLTLLLVGSGLAALQVQIPEQPPVMVLVIGSVFLVSVGIFRALSPLVSRFLAPFGGRLLNAVDRSIERLGSARTLDEVAQAVLLPMRDASASHDAEPFLYAFDPPLRASINAAGGATVEPRPLSPVVFHELGRAPRRILVRHPLEASVVRQPQVRPLVDALQALDAMCVVPLCSDSDLEGALVIPRGLRAGGLSLEEIAALERFARFVASFVAVLSAEARARQRAERSAMLQQQAEQRMAVMETEMGRLRADTRVLKAGQAADRLSVPPVAYSDAMRVVLERVRELAREGTPTMLVAEAGVPLDSVAYLLHAEGERASEAFVIGECASVSAEQCGQALFGEGDGSGEHPGWLPLAEKGTLLLLDLPALPREVQRTLEWALGSRQALRVDGDRPYPVDVRIVATSRSDPASLVAAGALDPQLASRFEPGAVRIPPLRERTEDLPSLILLELDRACRVLGRPVIGIEPEASRTLQSYDWPGNVEELRSVIEQAVHRCERERVSQADLPPLQPTGGAVPARLDEEALLGGTFEAVERRILKRAIANARGNKSEAARMLGLKRTTFLDKLRRHHLEKGKSAS